MEGYRRDTREREREAVMGSAGEDAGGAALGGEAAARKIQMEEPRFCGVNGYNQTLYKKESNLS